ncbi:MAG: RNA 2',3'-cyclic phosphodiesterase [Bacilli bacterium]
MRIFYAINFSDDVKEKLYQYIIKNKGLKASFTRKENIHLTIYFVGEINYVDLDFYIGVLDKVKFNNFEIEVEGFDFFHKKDGSIWHLKIRNNLSLDNLFKQIASSMNLNKMNFTPHITLARRVTDPKEIIKNDIEIDKIKVDSISLMESKFVDNKLVYTEIIKKQI